ncbi:MAG: 23S rRNA (adenine(2503)-C(2))-methyltransferase RlmN [Chlamydiae bacterium]|nr:23S rRNA (adenine(2503)-C(2))-methyltransferase RlmN [Chlamydiota bacterium]
MHLCSFLLQDLQNWLVERQKKSYQAKQIFEWIYQKKVLSFDQMTNLSKDFKIFLKDNFLFPSIKITSEVESEDKQTKKYLFTLEDNRCVEAVLIMSEDRKTICVSSQVGCPVKCCFCASGKKGLLRNLTTSEIVEQVLLILQKEEKISNIVFMGMGEPLENFDAVVKAIKLFNQEEAFNISQRRITLSTSGIPEKIIELADQDLNINLVLSIHAPNQLLREKLIPFAKKYPLVDILNSMDYYFEKTKRDIAFEYILIKDLNDTESHAKELAALLKNKQCSINLIPYNPIDMVAFKRSETDVINRFKQILISKDLVVTQRYTKGKDIAAACGQLAMQNNV